MLTVYDLKNQRMLTQPNFWKLVSGYEQFSGVTFVGSFQIIEKHLFPQFKQVNLILGMEDQRTGQNLNQFFDLTRRVKEITSANEQFISRVADESLKLRFTKEHLFHSKYYIVENDNQFKIFNGSMNLTQKALTNNFEMLWMYAGSKDNPADLAFYQAHQQLFKKNFTEDSTNYLDRKVIDQIKGKSAKEITEILTSQTVEQINDNTVLFPVEDITKITNSQRNQRYTLVPKDVKQVINTIYTPKGNKRRKTEEIKNQVKEIVYNNLEEPANNVVEANTLYPQPLWSYADDNVLVQQPNSHEFIPLENHVKNVTRDDVENFVKVIKSFKYNKVRDESQQALSAFMYLMTAPLIWKIRQIYRKSNYAKSADQVPLSMVLIGRGTTGKTLLVRDYFKPFVGDRGMNLQYSEINQGTGAHTNKAVNFLGNYLNSKRFISPMIVDELNENFLHSKVATNAIKQWSNTITDIHNVNIFAMNHNIGGRDINNLEEITKRVYYLSFEAGWLPPEKQKYNYGILQNNINDHIYKAVVYELNQRLVNLSGLDEQDLVDDYLSLTRKIVKELLAKFGLQDELKGIIDHNYDYKVDRNRLTWKMLIKDDDFKHVSFNSEDKQHFTVSKAIFNNLKGSTYENINQTLDNYFNMFPRELGVAIEQYNNGMILDIDKFDEFIGEPLIRQHYNSLHQKDKQTDAMQEYLKAQKQHDEQQNKMMTEMMKTIAKQQEQNQQSKPGLLSRLFKRK